MNQHVGDTEIFWYYDFISPFAYLQHILLKEIRRERADFQYTPVPVLFAGLLQHHGHKGPAEIPPKKELTYRYCEWYANRHQIPYQQPATHPFNPLTLLRLALSRGNTLHVIDRLFHYVWVESGADPTFFTVDAIAKIPGFETAVAETSHTAVKSQLRENTEMALSRGVFGVPTFQLDETLFWGLDMTEMMLEHWGRIGQADATEL